jgi:hypothetical protein
VLADGQPDGAFVLAVAASVGVQPGQLATMAPSMNRQDASMEMVENS